MFKDCNSHVLCISCWAVFVSNCVVPLQLTQSVLFAILFLGTPPIIISVPALLKGNIVTRALV